MTVEEEPERKEENWRVVMTEAKGKIIHRLFCGPKATKK
jgi:hypothetical protein